MEQQQQHQAQQEPAAMGDGQNLLGFLLPSPGASPQQLALTKDNLDTLATLLGSADDLPDHYLIEQLTLTLERSGETVENQAEYLFVLKNRQPEPGQEPLTDKEINDTASVFFLHLGRPELRPRPEEGISPPLKSASVVAACHLETKWLAQLIRFLISISKDDVPPRTAYLAALDDIFKRLNITSHPYAEKLEGLDLRDVEVQRPVKEALADVENRLNRYLELRLRTRDVYALARENWAHYIVSLLDNGPPPDIYRHAPYRPFDVEFVHYTEPKSAQKKGEELVNDRFEHIFLYIFVWGAVHRAKQAIRHKVSRAARIQLFGEDINEPTPKIEDNEVEDYEAIDQQFKDEFVIWLRAKARDRRLPPKQREEQFEGVKSEMGLQTPEDGVVRKRFAWQDEQQGASHASPGELQALEDEGYNAPIGGKQTILASLMNRPLKLEEIMDRLGRRLTIEERKEEIRATLDRTLWVFLIDFGTDNRDEVIDVERRRAVVKACQLIKDFDAPFAEEAEWNKRIHEQACDDLGCDLFDFLHDIADEQERDFGGRVAREWARDLMSHFATERLTGFPLEPLLIFDDLETLSGHEDDSTLGSTSSHNVASHVVLISESLAPSRPSTPVDAFVVGEDSGSDSSPEGGMVLRWSSSPLGIRGGALADEEEDPPLAHPSRRLMTEDDSRRSVGSSIGASSSDDESEQGGMSIGGPSSRAGADTGEKCSLRGGGGYSGDDESRIPRKRRPQYDFGMDGAGDGPPPMRLKSMSNYSAASYGDSPPPFVLDKRRTSSAYTRGPSESEWLAAALPVKTPKVSSQNQQPPKSPPLPGPKMVGTFHMTVADQKASERYLDEFFAVDPRLLLDQQVHAPLPPPLPPRDLQRHPISVRRSAMSRTKLAQKGRRAERRKLSVRFDEPSLLRKHKATADEQAANEEAVEGEGDAVVQPEHGADVPAPPVHGRSTFFYPQTNETPEPEEPQEEEQIVPGSMAIPHVPFRGRTGPEGVQHSMRDVPPLTSVHPTVRFELAPSFMDNETARGFAQTEAADVEYGSAYPGGNVVENRLQSDESPMGFMPRPDGLIAPSLRDEGLPGMPITGAVVVFANPFARQRPRPRVAGPSLLLQSFRPQSFVPLHRERVQTKTAPEDPSDDDDGEESDSDDVENNDDAVTPMPAKDQQPLLGSDSEKHPAVFSSSSEQPSVSSDLVARTLRERAQVGVVQDSEDVQMGEVSPLAERHPNVGSVLEPGKCAAVANSSAAEQLPVSTIAPRMAGERAETTDGANDVMPLGERNQNALSDSESGKYPAVFSSSSEEMSIASDIVARTLKDLRQDSAIGSPIKEDVDEEKTPLADPGRNMFSDAHSEALEIARSVKERGRDDSGIVTGSIKTTLSKDGMDVEVGSCAIASSLQSAASMPDEAQSVSASAVPAAVVITSAPQPSPPQTTIRWLPDTYTGPDDIYGLSPTAYPRLAVHQLQPPSSTPTIVNPFDPAQGLSAKEDNSLFFDSAMGCSSSRRAEHPQKHEIHPLMPQIKPQQTEVDEAAFLDNFTMAKDGGSSVRSVSPESALMVCDTTPNDVGDRLFGKHRQLRDDQILPTAHKIVKLLAGDREMTVEDNMRIVVVAQQLREAQEYDPADEAAEEPWGARANSDDIETTIDDPEIRKRIRNGIVWDIVYENVGRPSFRSSGDILDSARYNAPDEGRPRTPSPSEEKSCECPLGLDGHHDHHNLCGPSRCYDSDASNNTAKESQKWLNDELQKCEEGDTRSHDGQSGMDFFRTTQMEDVLGDGGICRSPKLLSDGRNELGTTGVNPCDSEFCSLDMLMLQAPMIQVAPPASSEMVPQEAPSVTSVTTIQRGFLSAPNLPSLGLEPARTMQPSWPPPGNAVYDATDFPDVYATVRSSPIRGGPPIVRTLSRPGLAMLSRGNSEVFSTFTEPSNPGSPAATRSVGQGQDDGEDVGPKFKGVPFARDDKIFSMEDEEECLGLEFCGKCRKRHIVPGRLDALQERDSCLSMLPEWFPQVRFPGEEWTTFQNKTSRYWEVCQVLAGFYVEHSKIVREPSFEKEFHEPTREWAKHGRYGGWWKCRIGSEDLMVPDVERYCKVCKKLAEDISKARAKGKAVGWRLMEAKAHGKTLGNAEIGCAKVEFAFTSTLQLLREKWEHEKFVRLCMERTMREDKRVVLRRIRATGS